MFGPRGGRLRMHLTCNCSKVVFVSLHRITGSDIHSVEIALASTFLRSWHAKQNQYKTLVNKKASEKHARQLRKAAEERLTADKKASARARLNA